LRLTFWSPATKVTFLDAECVDAFGAYCPIPVHAQTGLLTNPKRLPLEKVNTNIGMKKWREL